MKFIFIDTNIFIHFRHFEEINWAEALDTSEQIVITLAPIVVDELDKHKYNPIRKISNRARKLLPRIEEIIDNPSSCKIGFSIILDRPLDDTFNSHNLNRRENDDCLLATIIELQSKLSAGDSIIYITNDVGPRLKSKNLKIETKISPNIFIKITPTDAIMVPCPCVQCISHGSRGLKLLSCCPRSSRALSTRPGA